MYVKLCVIDIHIRGRSTALYVSVCVCVCETMKTILYGELKKKEDINELLNASRLCRLLNNRFSSRVCIVPIWAIVEYSLLFAC